MRAEACQTKKLILDTAMRVFFAEGRIHATTQDIADAAGVNRTLINYYFRSKKALIANAVKTTRKEFKRNSDLILSLSLPFREKTEKFIDDFLQNQFKYPYLESFVTAEIIQQKMKKYPSTGLYEKQPEPIRQYILEIEDEMKAGTIQKCNPAHFMMNMFSLMIYPIIMKPLQMSILNLDEKAYHRVLSERKQIIMDILFPSVV
jgi:TetR/AcrR family transcriptional regulator